MEHLVAPLTGKNQERNIVVVSMIENSKYQTFLPSQKPMLKCPKIQEIDKRKIVYKTKKKTDSDGQVMLDAKGKELYDKVYRPATSRYKRP